MEIDERFLTLLTPNGEFLRARKQQKDYTVGQEIDFFPVVAEEEKANKPSFASVFSIFKKKAIISVALAFILAIVSFLPFYQNDQVYAYMSIDINPSIELGVNEKLEVVELTPYNKEGTEIVKELQDWKGQEVHSVAKQILAAIEKHGYMNRNKEVVIATVYKGKREKETDKQLQKEISTIQKDVEKEKLELTVIEATEVDREKAKKQGVTAGVYKEKQMIKIQKKEPVTIEKNGEKQSNSTESPINPSSNQPLVEEKLNKNDDSMQQDLNELNQLTNQLEEQKKNLKSELKENREVLKENNQLKEKRKELKEVKKEIKENRQQLKKIKKEAKKEIKQKVKEEKKEMKKKEREQEKSGQQ
jgi:DNA repair exonuclease SbcCD ATPase subunit